MDLSYIITPFWAWFLTGLVKFAVNTLRSGRLAFDLIGYGGMPSNHSAIVSSVAAIIALNEGLESPALAVALALAFVVMLDANGLRRQVGAQAKIINELKSKGDDTILRERMGHTRLEVIVGMICGIVSAAMVRVLL